MPKKNKKKRAGGNAAKIAAIGKALAAVKVVKKKKLKGRKGFGSYLNGKRALAGPLPRKEQKISVPAAMGMTTRSGAPSINGGKSFIVKHREYLTDVLLQTEFDVVEEQQVYFLQPGLANEFPWLATIAGNFEQYRWRKLCYTYRARAPTSQAGTVYMATQLDVNDSTFSNKEQMYNYTGTTSNNVWTSFTHDCLLRRGDYLKKYFVRVGDLDPSAGQDQMMYDQGKFTYVALGTANVYGGELLVDYEIEFFNPKTSPAGGPSYLYNMEAVCNLLATHLADGSLTTYTNEPNTGAIATVSVGPTYPVWFVPSTANPGSLQAVFQQGAYKMNINSVQATSVNLQLIVTFTFLDVVSGTAAIATYVPSVGGAIPTNYALVGNAGLSTTQWFSGDVQINVAATSAVNPATHVISTAWEIATISPAYFNVLGHSGPTENLLNGIERKKLRAPVGAYRINFAHKPHVVKYGNVTLVYGNRPQIEDYLSQLKNLPLDVSDDEVLVEEKVERKSRKGDAKRRLE